MPVTVAFFLDLGRVEHDAQIGQMKDGQQTEGEIGQPDRPVALLPPMGAAGRAFPRFDAGAEDGRQLLSGHVLRVCVETERQQDGSQLKVHAVQQSADHVSRRNGRKRAVRSRYSEHIWRRQRTNVSQ